MSNKQLVNQIESLLSLVDYLLATHYSSELKDTTILYLKTMLNKWQDD